MQVIQVIQVIYVIHVIPTSHAFNASDVSSSSDANSTSDRSNTTNASNTSLAHLWVEFFSDWVAGAKWEARQQGTSLRQWQDSGSWLRPSLRTSHHIIVHSWKRNPVQSLLPNSNTFLAFKLFWSTRKLPLCHIQHHNCARKEGPPSPHKQSTILNPQST